MRNNPGGLLDQGVMVTDAFLDRGEIVSIRGRDADRTQRFSASSGDLGDGLPIVVLIKWRLGIRIRDFCRCDAGSRKGQRFWEVAPSARGRFRPSIPLNGNGALRLTTSRYYTPSGRSIQARGIDPDIVVLQDIPEELQGRDETTGEAGLRGHLSNEDEEMGGSSAYIPPDPEDDKQLLAALALLRGQQIDSFLKSEVETESETCPELIRDRDCSELDPSPSLEAAGLLLKSAEPVIHSVARLDSPHGFRHRLARNARRRMAHRHNCPFDSNPPRRGMLEDNSRLRRPLRTLPLACPSATISGADSAIAGPSITPQRPAIIEFGKRTEATTVSDYGDMPRQSNRLAKALQRRGVHPETRGGLLLPQAETGGESPIGNRTKLGAMPCLWRTCFASTHCCYRLNPIRREGPHYPCRRTRPTRRCLDDDFEHYRTGLQHRWPGGRR